MTALIIALTLAQAEPARPVVMGVNCAPPAGDWEVCLAQSLDGDPTPKVLVLFEGRRRVLGPQVTAGEIERALLPTFDEQRARALAEGKPLITWVGGNFCPRCVAEDGGREFVHYFADENAFEYVGVKAPAQMVSVPQGGQLLLAETITSWVVGDPTWGHIGSARGAVRRFRERLAGVVREPYPTVQRTYQALAQRTFQLPYQAPMLRQAPMLAPLRVRAGGC